MKSLLIAVAIVTTSLSALADGATYEYPRPAVSTITRAQVLDELKEAAASGALVSGERSYVAPPTQRALSRAEVRAELDFSQRDQQIGDGWFNFIAHTRATPDPQVAKE